MTKSYPLSLHIFRRDLRLVDNTALQAALAASHEVIPAFIFDPRQLDENPYKSDACIQFMVNSLQELDNELRKKNSQLYVFYGMAEDIVKKLLMALNIDAVFINRDYTPFSKKRDQAIENICKKHQVGFYSYQDLLLHEPDEILKPDRTPYTVFTHFFKRALQCPVRKPEKKQLNNYYQADIQLANKHILSTLHQTHQKVLFLKGGRKEALALLKQSCSLYDYQIKRDYPHLAYTSKLSAHNKFGTASIREVYHTIIEQLGLSHTLIKELYWRDFFTHISYHYPKVFGSAFHAQYDNIVWRNNPNDFRAWCEGRTGFPIIDAGMRELNTTGYMHNRIRMVVASFLTKDLHIDWRLGEKYFAQKLIDYDPAVNNGNWQWAASTGCDAQPYFRIFNPWLQQTKYDADCLYIKHWIPELASCDTTSIHQLYKRQLDFFISYPSPIVDHDKERIVAINTYKATAR